MKVRGISLPKAAPVARAGDSSRSSPPRRKERGPAWDWRWCSAEVIKPDTPITPATLTRKVREVLRPRN
jgi:hypothetical protein